MARPTPRATLFAFTALFRSHSILPTRVLLGAAARAVVPDEVTRLGADRVLLIATPSAGAAADDVAAALGGRLVVRFDRPVDRKSTRLNSRHAHITDAAFCLK